MSADALIINLTRFGDLLQTQPLLNDLHAAGRQTDLLCIANFASAASLLDNVHKVWPLPGAKLLGQLDGSWPAASGLLMDFASEIRRQKPECIINLTPSLPGRLLARLLALDGARTLGFGLDEYGYGVNHGIWASFVAVAATRRGNSPFNLSDIFRLLAAPLVPVRKGTNKLRSPAPEDMAWAKRFLAEKSGAFSKAPLGYVAFQLGASQESRRWPAANFQILARELWEKEKICPILTGSGREANLAEEYARLAATPFINAIGATSIPQLGALLTKCRLLVTNDTGTMHLAAGLGTPCLSFFVATAQPWDTGPALADCCCLEPALSCHPCAFGHECPDNGVCREQIDANTASRLALGYLRHGSWADAANMADTVRIWRTKEDKYGLIDLDPFNSAATKGPGAWMRWQRIFWQDVLAGIESQPMEAGKNAGDILPDIDAQPKPKDAKEIAQNLLQAANLLSSIAECGQNAAKAPALGKVFLKNCERLQSFLDSWPQMSSLGAFWREFRSSHGADLPVFCQQTQLLAASAKKLAAALSTD